MDKNSIAGQLETAIIKEIQDLYINGKIYKTNDCMNDMLRDGLYEADVEKVIMESTTIAKVMPASSPKASNSLNTHYVIHGTSTKGDKIYCKLCTNYDSKMNELIAWRLTSFCIK